jgi:predicted secreted protein
MNLFTGIIVFLMIFWTVLFMILPWGNKAEDMPEKGMAGSAPLNPRVKKKFIITFLVSIVIWGIIAALIHFEVIDFYEISRQMLEEDESR